MVLLQAWMGALYQFYHSNAISPCRTCLAARQDDLASVARKVQIGGRLDLLRNDSYMWLQVAATRKLQQKLNENKRQLVPLLGGNLVDAVWGSQPSAPTAAMRVHPQEYAGLAVPDKLKELLKQMEGALLHCSKYCPRALPH